MLVNVGQLVNVISYYNVIKICTQILRFKTFYVIPIIIIMFYFYLIVIKNFLYDIISYIYLLILILIK